MDVEERYVCGDGGGGGNIRREETIKIIIKKSTLIRKRIYTYKNGYTYEADKSHRPF